LQNRLIQTSQTGGQWYSDASTFSIPWLESKGSFTLAQCQHESWGKMPDLPWRRALSVTTIEFGLILLIVFEGAKANRAVVSFV
jgi:hypothetical protein